MHWSIKISNNSTKEQVSNKTFYIAEKKTLFLPLGKYTERRKRRREKLEFLHA